MQGRSGWAREDEFRDLLHKAASKATTRILDDIAALAIRDDKVVRRGGRGGASTLVHCACFFFCLLRHPPAPPHCRPVPSPPSRPPAWQAYKAVSGLLLHEMKQLRPQYRLKLLYVLSAILRQSKERRGDKDKYGGCCW